MRFRDVSSDVVSSDLASGGSRDVRLLVFRRTEGGPKLIGTAGVGQPLDRSEFGLWLSRAERRRGFAQEAGCALLSLAFDGLRLGSVWVPAFSDGAARRLITRLGFRRKSADSTQAVRKSTRLNYSHSRAYRIPASALKQ